MTQIKVVVIDGQRTFADALASRLTTEPGFLVVAVPESVTAAHRLLDGRPVDVVLLDSELSQSLDLAAELAGVQAAAPQPVQVIMLGPAPRAARLVEALRAGVVGWVRKEESVEHLLRAIRGVMEDEIWVPAEAVGSVLRLLLRERDVPATSVNPLGSLTPREREVLAYLAAGIGRREAAERMHLSAHTVRSHLQNLMGKLGVHTTLEAVAVARQAQLTKTRSRGSFVP
jgi:DNA-binding NarL/FixJ family response regulator